MPEPTILGAFLLLRRPTDRKHWYRLPHYHRYLTRTTRTIARSVCEIQRVFHIRLPDIKPRTRQDEIRRP